MRNWLIAVCLTLTASMPSFAQQIGGRGQGQGQRGAAAPPAGPAPRLANGHVNLSTVPNQAGVWQGDGRLVINQKSYEPRTTLNAWIDIKDVPLQDWARAMVDERHGTTLQFEPHARCKASGGPREFVTPYGFEIVEMPELQRVYIFDIGGPHSFRTIYMDQKEHSKDLLPSYYGHSIGHWEGDTLVVDAVGFNEKFWLSRDGLPHTDKLHLIERFTRTDARTLKYEVTIDDPGAYTAPWSSGFNLRWTEGLDLFEYVCQDNNLFPESVFRDSNDTRTTRIAP